MDYRDAGTTGADPQDLTDWLIPDTPASLVKDDPAPKSDPAPIPSTAELISAWQQEQERADQNSPSQGSSALVRPSEAPSEGPAPISPLIPRWAWKTAAYAVLGAVIVAFVAAVVWGVAWLLSEAAELLAAAAPVLGAAAAAVLAALVLLRSKKRGRITVHQSQTITFRK